jgi:hypothetical protein
MSRKKSADVIDAIAIAAKPEQVMRALAPEPVVVYRFHRAGAEVEARFRVEQRAAASLALVCTDDTTGLKWAGTRLHVAVVPLGGIGNTTRVALVHAGAPPKGYALAIDAWRSFLVELKDQLELATA